MRLRAAFEASERSYGSSRLKIELNQQGINIGRYKTRSLMRACQLKPVWKPKFVNTTDSHHDLPMIRTTKNGQIKKRVIV